MNHKKGSCCRSTVHCKLVKKITTVQTSEFNRKAIDWSYDCGMFIVIPIYISCPTNYKCLKL